MTARYRYATFLACRSARYECCWPRRKSSAAHVDRVPNREPRIAQTKAGDRRDSSRLKPIQRLFKSRAPPFRKRRSRGAADAGGRFAARRVHAPDVHPYRACRSIRHP
jgi:hypothetical protein